MRKTSVALALLLATAMLVPAGPAFGWGSATHAYIGHALRTQAGPVDLDEVYGSMAPDLFNFVFLDPTLAPLVPYLYGLTHGEDLEVRRALRRGWEKAEVYGFLSHNEAWAADLTAHVASRTLDPTVGYVITKARALSAILMTIPEYAALGLTEAQSVDICHNLIESAGDLIIAEASPQVGALMEASAMRPAGPLQQLLVRAWTPGLVANAGLTAEEAAALIIGWDTWFRDRVSSFGDLLQQPAPAPFQGVVADFATLAEAYLAAFGITLPPGTDLTPLIAVGIQQAMALCAPDYLTEVNATVKYTGAQLRRHRVLQKLR